VSITVLRIIAGVCGIASQVAGLVSLLLAVSMAPWFSWTENYLSVLGVRGSATALFNAGLVLAGAFSLIFAIGLGKCLLSGRWLGRFGTASLVLGSMAFAAIGVFPRTTGIPHNLASLAFFTFIMLAIFFIGVTLLNTSPKIWGVLSLAATALIAIFRLIPWPWSGGAIPQLLSCLPWSLWTIAFAVRLLIGTRLDA